MAKLVIVYLIHRIQLPNAKHVETADTGAAKSWYHTIKSMKPQKPGAKENVPNEFFSTFAAQSLLTTHAGKPIPAARQDLDNNIRWDDVSGIPPSAPQRVLIHPSKYVIGIILHYQRCYQV